MTYLSTDIVLSSNQFGGCICRAAATCKQPTIHATLKRQSTKHNVLQKSQDTQDTQLLLRRMPVQSNFQNKQIGFSDNEIGFLLQPGRCHFQVTYTNKTFSNILNIYRFRKSAMLRAEPSSGNRCYLYRPQIL